MKKISEFVVVLIVVVGLYAIVGSFYVAGCGEVAASATKTNEMSPKQDEVVSPNFDENFTKLAAGFRHQCKCVETLELDREMAKRVFVASGGIDGGVGDITKDQMNELILWWMTNHPDAFFDALVPLPPTSRDQPKM